MKVFSRGSLGNEGMVKGIVALKSLTTPDLYNRCPLIRTPRLPVVD